jgi:hypothetical protein
VALPCTARTVVPEATFTLPTKRRSARAFTCATVFQLEPLWAWIVTSPAAGARPHSCARPFFR